MKRPGVTALICLCGVVISGWSLLFPGPETPGMAVTVLNWVLFAGTVIGLIGSLVELSRQKND